MEELKKQKKDFENNNLTNNKNNKADYLIIGNSAAGLAAASAIRSIDKKGKILVITNEEYKNYSKPLITYFIAGKVKLENIYFKNEQFYEDNNILLFNNINIKKIDFKKKLAFSDNNLNFTYKKLLFANGGTPIIPEIQVVEDNKLINKSENEDKIINSINSKAKIKKEDNSKFNFNNTLNSNNYKEISGIFTLTSLTDAINIKKYIEENKIKEAVILGGGLIGLKSAEALLEIGIKINIIELADRLLSATFDKNASLIIENQLKNNSSKIYTKNTINKIFIKNDKLIGNKLIGVELSNKEIIKSNLLIIAIGVIPDLRIIKESEKLNKKVPNYGKGIYTDKYMKTSIVDIYAAGDVVENYDLLSGNNANIAIWPLAVKQGEVAGMNMAGISMEYNGGYFMNSIEILGIPSISIGFANLNKGDKDEIEVIYDFKPEKNFYKKIVISEEKIIGVILVGNIDRAGIYNGLIKNKVNIAEIKENLVKENFGIIQLPIDYRKHLVIGDGIEV